MPLDTALWVFGPLVAGFVITLVWAALYKPTEEVEEKGGE